jgi:precorrin-3B synthase
MTSTSLRKGWCPGALRPMPAKDGLLVRLRIRGATLSARSLRRIAAAGRAHGSGFFDLTSRANLQLRGVSPQSLPLLLEALDTLNLVDATVSAEQVRNVLVGPLAGLEAEVDIRLIAAALEAALGEDQALHALPAKFGFLLDDGLTLPLDAVPADIRFRRLADGNGFAMALGGTASQAIVLGVCAKEKIVPVALALAHGFLRLRANLPQNPLRMRDLLLAIGPGRFAIEAGLSQTPPYALPPIAESEFSPIGTLHIAEKTFCFGAGAAFGRVTASMLEAAAEAAERFGPGEVRISPWRALILPGVEESDAKKLHLFLGSHDFITTPEDDRLAVAACGGLPACTSATTDTHADALALSDLARRLQKTGIALHLSGCNKGCARPATTAYTLVGQAGLYDLILNGTPADGTRAETGLSLAQARRLLENFAEQRDKVH